MATTINVMILAVLIDLVFVIVPTVAMVWGPERGGDQCQNFVKETIAKDRATAADDTPSRMHNTWLSQGCETRSGPEYLIRKYTFFENGTFLLLRHHYAEESCSVATHTVTSRGVLWLISPSILTPGATEARFQLDTVHVIPLNRQVAHKLGHRVNSSCGHQPKWRPYVPQLVYEQPLEHRIANPLWEGPRYNSLQGNTPSRKRRGFDCLEPLGIEFGELRLVRVQKKPLNLREPNPRRPSTRPKVELLLGSLPSTVQTRFTHKPTGLQSTALLRIDSISSCPMCNAIARGTETSPPVMHELAALPAILGGSWVSKRCESIEGGLWVRRQLQIWSGDKLWTGRWDHFGDPRCGNFLYTITGAGSYVQRAGRQRRHRMEQEVESFGTVRRGDYLPDPTKEELRRNRRRRDVVPWMTPELAKNIWDIYAPKREEIAAEGMLPTFDEIREAISRESSDSTPPSDDPRSEPIPGDSEKQIRKRNANYESRDSYRHLLQNAQPSLAESYQAMLRGNQRYQETTPKTPVSSAAPYVTPTGTTELDLHVAESILSPGDPTIQARCGGVQLSVWPRDCVPKSLEAPGTLGLRARVGVTWTGEYTLTLGPRDSSLWEAPLYQCGPSSFHNPELRAHLRTSVGLRYGLFLPSGSGEATKIRSVVSGLLATLLFFIR
ncbi:uncharacterized protein LOC105687732 isoform X2 [Athalia rosae]|uniref:uncharacterized protein LOC105687732 isoform X2 n=1 Tax=Athalia rosae TaxID=37344 RepID=UPI0020340A00|nr:uncharacterized protein LOC105687732 isoform X2 [Athalia rosae]